jgi:hypothetical protein
MTAVVQRQRGDAIALGMYYGFVLNIPICIGAAAIAAGVGQFSGQFGAVFLIVVLAVFSIAIVRTARCQVVITPSGILTVTNPIRRYAIPASAIRRLTTTQLTEQVSAVRLELDNGHEITACGAPATQTAPLLASLAEWSRPDIA